MEETCDCTVWQSAMGLKEAGGCRFGKKEIREAYTKFCQNINWLPTFFQNGTLATI